MAKDVATKSPVQLRQSARLMAIRVGRRASTTAAPADELAAPPTPRWPPTKTRVRTPSSSPSPVRLSPSLSSSPSLSPPSTPSPPPQPRPSERRAKMTEKELMAGAIRWMTRTNVRRPNGSPVKAPAWYKWEPQYRQRPRLWTKDWCTGKVRPRMMIDDDERAGERAWVRYHACRKAESLKNKKKEEGDLVETD